MPLSTETNLYIDDVFAPLDHDHHLERIAGGNETEVYRTDDHRYVVKLKHDTRYPALHNVSTVLQRAQLMRAGAEEFARCLGPCYSVPSYFVISRDTAGELQVLVVQPFVTNSCPLSSLDYSALSRAERLRIAQHLRHIIHNALTMYRAQGRMPDLYGRTSASKQERLSFNAPHMLPWRLWSFLVERNLLRSHNLLVSNDPDRRIVLIDYDMVMRSQLYRTIYYVIRWMLFWRDQVLITMMRQGGRVL